MNRALLPRKAVQWGITTVGVVLAMTLSACGNDNSSDAKAVADDGSPASMVPKEMRDRGYINVAGDASYPPIGYIGDDGKTIEGLDADLAKAIGEVLDIELRKQNTSFDSIIPGLQGNKFELGMSWMNDTEERREVVDFIDYSRDGSSILVLAKSAKKPTSLTEMCGMSVAVQKGTIQQTDATTQSDKCEKDGKGSIKVQTYPDQSAANLALKSGRADLTIADTPVAIWQQKQTGGELEVVGEPYGPVYHGVAAPKGSDLVPAVAAAMQELIDNGKYLEILDKWGMKDAAIDEILVNGEPAN